MSLTLHAGATAVSYDDLRALTTPAGTDTHVPVPHHEIVELVRYTLGFYNHEIVEEHHAIMPDGARYFGAMTLRSPYGDYGDVVGLRNSHDKSFPIGIAFGSRVFVCDNMAFVGDHVIRRKHTAKAKRELPGLVTEIVAPLQAQRLAQNQKLLAYQRAALTDEAADHAIPRCTAGISSGCSGSRMWWTSGNVPPTIGGTRPRGGSSMPQLLPSPAKWRNGPTSPKSSTR